MEPEQDQLRHRTVEHGHKVKFFEDTRINFFCVDTRWKGWNSLLYRFFHFNWLTNAQPLRRQDSNREAENVDSDDDRIIDDKTIGDLRTVIGQSSDQVNWLSKLLDHLPQRCDPNRSLEQFSVGLCSLPIYANAHAMFFRLKKSIEKV